MRCDLTVLSQFLGITITAGIIVTSQLTLIPILASLSPDLVKARCNYVHGYTASYLIDVECEIMIEVRKLMNKNKSWNGYKYITGYINTVQS